MGDWSYLSALLDKVQSHSTVVGKIWMSVLFLFRIFVLGAAADKVWGDEVSEFYCDSHEPGCAHACYNWMFPISYIHYWVLQIIFVSTPTLVYLGYAVHIIHKEKKMMVHMQSNTNCNKMNGWMKPKYTDDRGKVKIKGILFGTYLTQLVFKLLLEVAFAVGQIYIYGSIFIVPYFHCSKSPPCARMSGAQCYISRPTEKSIFILFMLVVSGISVLLNIIEIIYLICHNRKSSKKQFVAQPHQFSSEQLQMQPRRGTMRVEYEGCVPSPLPSKGHEGDCTDDPHFNLASKEKEN